MKKKLFGTDGIRGVANKYPITPEVMIKLGQAIITSLPNSAEKKRILIGKDTRVSGDMIESAIAAGICSMNGDVFLAGVLPTPGISCLTVSGGYDAGIVISASHNPYYDNGIKIFNKQGFKLTDRIEKEIEDKVLDDSFSHNKLLSKKIGIIKNFDFPKQAYIDFLVKTLPQNYSFKGLKIILDCSNGATSEVAPKLFKELGADIITIFSSPNGTNISEQCGSQHTETLRETVLKNNADIGFAFDGDGDRLIAVDDHGNEITGDQILAVCAKFMKEKGELSNNVVVSTVMSNVGLRQVFKKLNINHIMADVGDRYVLEQMQKNNSIIGGEDSGHMIFLDQHTSGDGILAAIRLIQVIKETSQSLSQLVQIIKIYPQVLLNVPVKEKVDIRNIPEINKVIDNVENQLQDQGRVLVRYSGTQPLCRVMVEGPHKDETLQYCQDIVNVIQEKIGA